MSLYPCNVNIINSNDLFDEVSSISSTHNNSSLDETTSIASDSTPSSTYESVNKKRKSYLLDSENEYNNSYCLPLTIRAKPKRRDSLSYEEQLAKKQRRKDQNKRAAQKSRENKKHYIQQLEVKFHSLNKENNNNINKIKALEKENSKLKKQLERLRSKNGNKLENISMPNEVPINSVAFDGNEISTERVPNVVQPSPTAVSEFLLQSNEQVPFPDTNLFNESMSAIDLFDLPNFVGVHDNACRLPSLFNIQLLLDYTRIFQYNIIKQSSLQWMLNKIVNFKLVQIAVIISLIKIITIILQTTVVPTTLWLMISYTFLRLNKTSFNCTSLLKNFMFHSICAVASV